MMRFLMALCLAVVLPAGQTAIWGGDHVRMEVTKSGAELDTQAEHVWEVRDGKVSRFENKVDQGAWASGWS